MLPATIADACDLVADFVVKYDGHAGIANSALIGLVRDMIGSR